MRRRKRRQRVCPRQSMAANGHPFGGPGRLDWASESIRWSLDFRSTPCYLSPGALTQRLADKSVGPSPGLIGGFDPDEGHS
jgi:hypothetical protein